MGNVRVSVIVPGYNVEEYIEECLDSLVRQTLDGIQVIMVNDGSTDSTPRIMDEYAKIYDNFQVIHQENQGLSMARNNAVPFAFGEYLAFVDSDDYVSNDAYEKMYTKIKDTGSDMLVCGVLYFSSNGVTLPPFYRRENKDNTHVTKNPELMKDITAWNKLFKKSFWDQHQFSFPKGIRYEDYPTMIAAHFLSTSTDILSTPIYYWRSREGGTPSLTQRMHELQSLQDYITGLQIVENFFCKYEVPAELKEVHYSNVLQLLIVHHVNRLPLENEEYIREVQKSITSYLQNISDSLFEKLPLAAQIKYNLLKENNIKKLIYFIENEKNFNEKQISISNLNKVIKRKMDTTRLFQNKRHSAIIVIGSPEHGNLGDQAIAITEQKFLKEKFPNRQIIEITDAHFWTDSHGIVEKVHSDDIIIVHGGGFLGTLWMAGEMMARNIINLFPHNKIIIFPQTMHFEDTPHGKQELLFSKEIYEAHPNLSICLRDKKSYDFAIQNFSERIRYLLVPDIVTYLNATKQPSYKRSGALLCIRTDHEKVIGDNAEKELETILEKYQLKCEHTSMIAPYRVGLSNRLEEVTKKIIEFKQYEVVITDRLHGMLFAAISGTPCIALDNISKKVSGVYSWIEHLDYIKFADNISEIDRYLGKVLGTNNCIYDNQPLSGYYDLICKEI